MPDERYAMTSTFPTLMTTPADAAAGDDCGGGGGAVRAAISRGDGVTISKGTIAPADAMFMGITSLP